MKILIYFTILLFSLNASATERDFWGTKLIINSPDSYFSELCREYEEVYQLIAKTVIPPQVLVTCFMNLEEMANEEETIIFKLSIVREYLPVVFKATEFDEKKTDFISSLKEFDADPKEEEELLGNLTSNIASEEIAVEDIQRNPWKLAINEDNYALLNTSSKFKAEVEGKIIERQQVIVAGILLLKGKIVFVRVSNSKDHKPENTIKLTENWLNQLLRGNQ